MMFMGMGLTLGLDAVLDLHRQTGVDVNRGEDGEQAGLVDEDSGDPPPTCQEEEGDEVKQFEGGCGDVLEHVSGRFW